MLSDERVKGLWEIDNLLWGKGLGSVQIEPGLARDPAALAALKAKLARNRRTEPLFDSPRFTRHLEAVYRALWQRHQSGLAPALIDPGPTIPKAASRG